MTSLAATALTLLLVAAQIPDAASSVPGWAVFAGDRGLARSERQCLEQSNEKVALAVTGRQVSAVVVPSEEQTELDLGRIARFLDSKQQYRASALMESEGGVLVGTDGGEWGGQLLWIPSTAESADDVVELAQMNVVAIVEQSGDILVLSGTAHLDTDMGSIHKVVRNGRRVAIRFLADLKGKPYAFLASRSRVIAVTSTGVVSVRGKKMRYLRKVDLSDLPISSLGEAPDGSMFVGVGHVLLRIDERGSALSWLTRTHCVAAKTPVCGCGASMR